MIDNEIIKALECCVSEQYTCEQCPYQEIKHYDSDNGFEIMSNGKQYDDWSCERWLNTDLLDLINRQKAEIAVKDKLLDIAEEKFKKYDAEIKEQQSEIKILKDSNINLQELYKTEREKVKTAKQKCIDIAKALKNAKAEAVKEFAENAIERVEKAKLKYQRLCKEQGEEMEEHMHIHFNGIIGIIDNLLKEMVGEYGQ